MMIFRVCLKVLSKIGYPVAQYSNLHLRGTCVRRMYAVSLYDVLFFLFLQTLFIAAAPDLITAADCLTYSIKYTGVVHYCNSIISAEIPFYSVNGLPVKN